MHLLQIFFYPLITNFDTPQELHVIWLPCFKKWQKNTWCKSSLIASLNTATPLSFAAPNSIFIEPFTKPKQNPITFCSEMKEHLTLVLFTHVKSACSFPPFHLLINCSNSTQTGLLIFLLIVNGKLKCLKLNENMMYLVGLSFERWWTFSHNLRTYNAFYLNRPHSHYSKL